MEITESELEMLRKEFGEQNIARTEKTNKARLFILRRRYWVKRGGWQHINVHGLVHRILRKAHTGLVRAKDLRSSTFHMHEFEECLVYGLLRQENHRYYITLEGEVALERLNAGYEKYLSNVQVRVNVSKHWYSYFGWHVW